MCTDIPAGIYHQFILQFKLFLFFFFLFVMYIIEFKLTLFRNCLTCRMLQRVILRDMQLHLVMKQ